MYASAVIFADLMYIISSKPNRFSAKAFHGGKEAGFEGLLGFKSCRGEVLGLAAF